MRANALFAFILLLGIFVADANAQSPAATGGVQYGTAPAPAPDPAAPVPAAGTGGVKPGQPGTAPAPGSPTPVVPGAKAVLLADGSAAAPADAPLQVQQAIWAANSLQDKPYRYGGGHATPIDTGYDCSGTVSFAFKAAGVLETPLDSGSFMRWGEAGRGQWLTVYAHGGHAYAIIAGLRLDTSATYARTTSRARRTTMGQAAEKGPRWRPSRRSSAGFAARHPAGF